MCTFAEGTNEKDIHNLCTLLERIEFCLKYIFLFQQTETKLLLGYHLLSMCILDIMQFYFIHVYGKKF